MKKKILVTLAVMFLLTGCGDKKLTCKSDAKTEDMQIKQKYVLIVEKNKVTKVKSEKEYVFKNEELYKSFENVVNHSKSNVEELGNKKIEFKTKKDKDSYKLIMEVNMKDVNDEEIASLGLNKKANEFKTTLEEQGLTCK